MKRLFLLLVPFLLLSALNAQENEKYKLPPQELVDLIDAPLFPNVSFSPDEKYMLVLERNSLPGIKDISKIELGLAGIKFNPGVYTSFRNQFLKNIRLISLADYQTKIINGLPQNARIESVRFSPDGSHIAFLNTTDNGVELWIVNLNSLTAKKLTEKFVHNTMQSSYQWLSDNKTIIFKSTIHKPSDQPPVVSLDQGPVIQENYGKEAPVRTYQDLLKNKNDEISFEFYFTSQLCKISLDGKVENIGKPGIISSFSTSPDANYILVETIHAPFSYLVQYDRFPCSVELWNNKGELVKQIADIPASEDIPKGFDAVRKGPRSFSWRSDKPAELYWVEARDDGNPQITSAVRDILFRLDAPFDKQPREILDLNLRFSNILWGNGGFAIIVEKWWKTRKAITSSFAPDSLIAESKEKLQKTVIFDKNTEDSYAHPGDFVTITNQYGRSVLFFEEDGKSLFLIGDGDSPSGKIPFVDLYIRATKERVRLWKSQAPFFEYAVSIKNIANKSIYIRRESKEDPPNYFRKNIENNETVRLTDVQHPYPALKNISKQIITYLRKDGVKLSANLYLPPDYNPKKDGRIPVIMWAYPQEFKNPTAAGQIKDSPYKFPRINFISPIVWLTQGFAVLDDPTMPIIGEGKTEPNDTYIDQLVESARAAVAKLYSMGIADTAKIVIGGHSYGAFMAANLLCHSDLFSAGICMSGAYNRTLTPFGFQSEERTLWEAAPTYLKMSPFLFADMPKKPILLIHGMDDNNSGTFPMQSERFFAALKGNGKTARLVLLPHESHSYRARESILHVLWEEYNWMNKFVLNK